MPSEPEAAIQFPAIASEINAMAMTDQNMRQRALAENVWDETVDASNTARIKEIVYEIGWPTISRVGREASSNAWLLVQHADRDVAFQSACLALMKQEPPAEVSPQNIAMLEDRVRVNSSQPQIYGTQFDEVDGAYVPRPMEDMERVDERRKLMGLGSLEEGMAQMHAKYGPPRQNS